MSFMLSKNKIKFIKSLDNKKSRDESGQFIIEGNKIVSEFINAGWNINLLVAQPRWTETFPERALQNIEEIIDVENNELRKISLLKTPHNVLAIVNKPEFLINWNEILNNLTLVLETIQDPGNLGTIIRTAAWFGINNIICSPDSVDVFNQKVIQASMGAILRVKVHYTNLIDFMNRISENNFPVYGASLDGMPIYNYDLSANGIILLGNESSGISPSLKKYITQKIKIPCFSDTTEGIDSLNVSMAAAIICSEFRRKTRGYSK
ncbi:MAG: RNA methyltransferase [Bacteroidales bacterium]|nr:RNA methyltransferase [Bacteroidales bacterium]